jgi:hypothetical protein
MIGITPHCRRFISLCIATFIFLVGFSPILFAQIDTTNLPMLADSALPLPAAPTSVLVSDVDYDAGNALRITWTPSLDEGRNNLVTGYALLRFNSNDSITLRETLSLGTTEFVDNGLNSNESYRYAVSVLSVAGETRSILSQSTSPKVQWFDIRKRSLLIMALIIGGAILLMIELARKRPLFIRRVAGLDAIDDAIGRATEMGRPVLYIPGIQDMDDVETLASLTILRRVAKVAAEFDCQLEVPVSRSLVMTAARDAVKNSFIEAGRPDSYREDAINYITDEQFAYVGAVGGIMNRKRPAANFLLGAFFGEALVLAEMGNSVGAIQVGGTARPQQIPFFVVACDYTLIGEELFAASAYLSGEPKQLGSLRGQDVGKVIAIVSILTGAVLATMSGATSSTFIFFKTLFTAG